MPLPSRPWRSSRAAAHLVVLRVLRSLLVPCAVLALSACGGGDGPSGTPGAGQSTTLANLSPVSNTSYLAPAGTRVATEVVVSARNPFDLIAVGATLTATATAGGTVSPATTTTDAAGEARFQWTLGRVEGDQTLTVTPSGGGRPATFTAFATRPSVASVSLTPAPLPAMVENDTLRVSASALDSLAVGLLNRTFTWSSANAAVLSVTPSGATALLRALAPGTAQVTVTSEGRSAMFGVTVTAGTVASVVITPPAPTVVAGQTVTLSAAARDVRGTVLTGRTLRWRSAMPTVATIDSVTGVATGITGGTTLITATSEGVASAAVTLTVTNAPVATVTITPASPSVDAGQTVQLTAALRDAAGTPLTGRVISWTSSNDAVATVTGTGLVSGVSPGTTTIRATSEGRDTTATLTVRPTPVASLDVTPSGQTIVVGGTVQMTAVARDGAGNTLPGRTITWSASPTGVASINSTTGLATGVSAGTATMTATSEGRMGSVPLTVQLAPVASVIVAPSPATVAIGGTAQFSAVARDASGGILTGRSVTWTSSPSTVATVNGSGLVSGVGVGSATITATIGGMGGNASLTVTPAPVALVTVSPATPILLTNGTLRFTAVLTDAAGNVLTGRTVTWNSSNGAVAGINPTTGDALAVSVGTATITATSEGQIGSVTLRVQPTFACGGAPALGCGLGAEQFVTIPATVTPFPMGSNVGRFDEQPVHAVSITRAFAMQRTEVTQGQWRAVMAGTALANPSFFTACGDLCPVERVSWDDVQVLIARLNAITPGGTYRLPTEAEWEYAARAGTTTETYGPIDAIAWYSGNNTPNGTKRVATRTPNSFGLYDMLGNVWEWVNDCYSSVYYGVSPVVDPQGPNCTSSRVLRGGSWGNVATDVRAGIRVNFTPSNRFDNFGFRLVRTP